MFDVFLRRGASEPTKSTATSSSSLQSSSSALPVYSPLSAQTFDTPSSPSSPTSDLPLDPLHPAQRHAIMTPPQTFPHLWPPAASRPSLSRFLADFTLGFADGLTVPFALTAGLSSLGQTDTVIYAGMAEICAGSISMGIGGYLSAKGEAQTSTIPKGQEEDADEDEEKAEEKDAQMVDTTVERYLAPLNLPPELLDLVKDHARGRHDVATALARQQTLLREHTVDDDDDDDNRDDGDDKPPSPIMSGLSVALGYLIGGSLPLFPYFVVVHVGDGLMWSFIVCIIALFVFGFTKDLVLHIRRENNAWMTVKDLGRRRCAWADIRRSSWEGLQMVLLGSIAAIAAVLCVRLFESMAQDVPQPRG